MSIPTNIRDINSFSPARIEEYRGRKDPEAVKAVAKEMEALFACEMLKAMRATASLSSDKGMGNDVYMSMFDVELSKLFAARGLGLQNMLLEGLNKAQQKADAAGGQSQHQEALKENNRAENTHKDVAVEQINAQTSSNPKKGYESPQTDGNEEFLLPVNGKVSSAYGLRRHPIYGDNRFHHGVDIAAPEGADILPARSGRVIFSGTNAGYGNMVVIDHGDGFVSKYAHNSVNLVREGDRVETNTVIARVGNTGESTGPHLHFEVKYNGRSIDPESLRARV